MLSSPKLSSVAARLSDRKITIMIVIRITTDLRLSPKISRSVAARFSDRKTTVVNRITTDRISMESEAILFSSGKILRRKITIENRIATDLTQSSPRKSCSAAVRF